MNLRFTELANEAAFTKEMLGSGATQIRRANYATKGIYFQAFSNLSTGFERIGKLSIILDYYITQNGSFPTQNYLKQKFWHRLTDIYNESINIVSRNKIKFKYLPNLDAEIYKCTLVVLSDFAVGDRYANINFDEPGGQFDPIKKWHDSVDELIWKTMISQRSRERILNNSKLMSPYNDFSFVYFAGEDHSDIKTLEDGSYRSGKNELVSAKRQLIVLQMIRYWFEVIWGLQDKAENISLTNKKYDIPHFSEILSGFWNDDSYLRTRKTWD